MRRTPTSPAGRKSIDDQVVVVVGHDGRRSLTSALASARPVARRTVGLGAAAAGVAVGRLTAHQRGDEQEHPRDVVTVPEPGTNRQMEPAEQAEQGA